MIHARDDYNRIQDPEGKIGADEPVFLIRGQDRAGPFAVESYAIHAERQGATPEFVNTCRVHARRMRDWQKHNGSKVPDL